MDVSNVSRTMLAAVVPVLLFAACTESPRESEMPQEDTMTEMPGAYTGVMDQYRTRIEHDLGNLDMEIDNLRLQMESDAETLSDSFRVRVASLQYRRDALETELRTLPDATEAQQESRRQAIETQWNRIVEDLESLRLSAIADRGAFEAAIDARLTELEMELSDFQRYAASDDALNTERHAQTMQTLQNDLNELSTTLSTFKSVSDPAFKAQRTALADAVADLGARIREATDEVRKDDDTATVVRSSLP